MPLEDFLKSHSIEKLNESDTSTPNHMLIGNYIMKAEKAAKNIEDWLIDVPDATRQRIASNLSTLVTHLTKIKEENNKASIS